MQTPVLQVRNLSYRYDDCSTALEDINLSIYEGEKIAVLGSNGAGKSTFFLNLNGVLTPDEGTIIYHGREIKKKDFHELRKHIGIVFQDADNQIIASTVLAEVSFGPMNLKLPKEVVRQRVEEALVYMNIFDFKDRPPHYLSGGEKKKVSIADIIAMKPEIIIFDEPAAALDPLNADMLESVLEQLSDEKKTMLISTHDMDFAYRWADRIIVFSGGKVIADETPVEVFRDGKALEAANLKRPALMEIYELMVEYELVAPDGCYPRSVKAFQAMLSQVK